MDDQLLVFNVGKKTPEPFLRREACEGAVFELADNGQAFICLYIRDLDEEIIQMISEEPIRSAYYSRNTFWVGLLKIGDLLASLTFNPMKHLLAYGSFNANLFRKNRLVTILGVDGDSMIIKTIRVVAYAPNFLSSLYFTFANFKPSESYNEQYDHLLNVISVMTIEHCWRLFEKTDVFGE
jgi:hypothetical protein